LAGLVRLFALAGPDDKGFAQQLGKLAERIGWNEILDITGIIVLAMVFGWAFKRLVLVRFQRMAQRTDNDVDDRLVYFLARFYKGLIVFAVALVVLRILKIELTPLLAGAGIIGIGIAYGAKDVIGNFLAGVFLLVDRPIKRGDRILIESIGRDWGSWGDVVDVGLRSTTVKNTDGVYVTYPNAKLAESVIRNFSPTDDPMRFRVRVLVAYDEDVEQALKLMTDVAKAEPGVLDKPAPYALLRSLFSQGTHRPYDGALLELRCFVDDIRVRTKLRSKLLLAVKAAFEEHDISFAQHRLSVDSTRNADGD
jgi:small-conductance mechanosensitive channel